MSGADALVALRLPYLPLIHPAAVRTGQIDGTIAIDIKLIIIRDFFDVGIVIVRKQPRYERTDRVDGYQRVVDRLIVTISFLIQY